MTTLREAAPRPILPAMDPASDPTVVRLGDFLFDRSTGEVREIDGDRRTRLAPQPAKLLDLLIEKEGELATRAEIRSRVWPETHVDFDRSLHFCVRQIRAALGESAAESTYIETLPRRGYRLARTVVPAGEHDALRSPARPPSTPARAGRWSPWIAVALGLAVLVGLLLAVLPRRAPVAAAPPRLAVMPFELAAEGERGEGLARISEWLVAELAGGGVEVVGPRSTGPYSAFPFPDLDRMAAELEVDHVLNARYFDDDGEPRLIVELIRLSDRAHPWAEIYDDSADWQTIAREARDAVSAALDGGPSGEAPADEVPRGEPR